MEGEGRRGWKRLQLIGDVEDIQELRKMPGTGAFGDNSEKEDMQWSTQ